MSAILDSKPIRGLETQIFGQTLAGHLVLTKSDCSCYVNTSEPIFGQQSVFVQVELKTL